ncbi:fimbria/pilus outer membrane usher protein [Pantoea sp. AS142]|uniref:fimbria/pilus outer membrane usher protein n=1 Tax=Pantoea sp. AS142 TaxID=3081292 RepID=UPI0030185AEC
MLAISFSAQGADQYDLSLLENKGNAAVDASWFNKGNDILPGEYDLQLIINEKPLRNTKISVGEYQGKILPLFTTAQLAEWGLKFKHLKNKSAKLPLDFYFPHSKVDIDQGEQTISLTVPQKNFSESTEDDVASEDEWDYGINAAFTNYSLQYDQARTQGVANEQNVSGTLENGINLGEFQLRNSGYLDRSKQQNLTYRSSTSYVRHDIDALSSTALAGDFNTSGLYFSSLPLRGISLASNMEMFSSEEKSYMPAIVGIASGNATIIVRQNGYVIATRNVTPGPYSIKDIPAMSGAGDLQVTVREANGSEHIFYQPYNNIEMLMPIDVFKYALDVGKIRNTYTKTTSLLESDMQYGISSNLTLLGGLMYAENYANSSVGIGVNARYVGAMYGIVNLSQNSLAEDGTQRAEKFKIGINRELSLTKTYLSASYEQQTSVNYAELTDASHSVQVRTENGFRKKASIQLEQAVGLGNLALIVSQQTNWNGSASTDVRSSLNYDFSYFTLISSIDNQRRPDGSDDKTFSVTISIPLGREKYHYLSLSNTAGQQNQSQQVALTGNLLQQRQLGYDVNMQSSTGGKQFSSTLNYLSEFGNSTGSFQTSNEGQRLTLGILGAAIIHRHGLTLGQRMGNAAALVHTDHVSKLSVENEQDVRTDSRGNAFVPDITAYHHNEESLINNSKNKNIDIPEEIFSATPRTGAIVELDFAAHAQQKQFIRLMDEKGNAIPFGNALYSVNGRMVGIISGGGVAHVNVTDDMWPLHYNKNNQNIMCSQVKKDNQFIWDVVCDLH